MWKRTWKIYNSPQLLVEKWKKQKSFPQSKKTTKFFKNFLCGKEKARDIQKLPLKSALCDEKACNTANIYV